MSESKENNPLYNNELNLSPASKRVVSVPSSGSKRRRLSINPITGDFQLEDSNTPALKNISNETSTGLTPALQKKSKIKDRHSMSRRVSFATTAHVRFFDKDHEKSDDSSPASTPKSSSSAKQKKKKKESTSTPLKLTLDQADTSGSGFQVPDLSSIRNSGDNFDLRLSPTLENQNSFPQDEPSTDMSIAADNNSFEVHLKGSPSDMSLCNYDNSAMSMALVASSPEKFNGPETEPIGNRRDSIAAFFETAPASPLSDESAVSTPARTNANPNSTATTTSGFSSTKKTTNITPKKSPRRVSRKSSRLSSARRDSVAAFFEPFKNSPLRNEICFDDFEDEDENSIQNEASMDLMGDMSAITTKERDEDDMSIASTDATEFNLLLDREESMNMTVCIGGIKDVFEEESLENFEDSTPKAIRIVSTTNESSIGNNNNNKTEGDDDTIGRFFFNPTGESSTPRLFSSPMSNVDLKATPKIFATNESIDSDDDIPSRLASNKSDLQDSTMDVTRCVGGILRQAFEEDVTETLVHEKKIDTEKTDDFSVVSVQSFVNKMATPMRLPAVQQLNMNSTKIANSVKRLDNMLKDALKQGTPSRRKAVEQEGLNSDKENIPVASTTKTGIDSNLEETTILKQQVEIEDVQENMSLSLSFISENQPVEIDENIVLSNTPDAIPTTPERPGLVEKLQSEVQVASTPRRSPRIASRRSSGIPMSSSKKKKTVLVSPAISLNEFHLSSEERSPTTSKVSGQTVEESQGSLDAVAEDDDLLDEHLSVMDCSFSHEPVASSNMVISNNNNDSNILANNDEINTLTEFFNATGIQFEDLETPVVNVNSIPLEANEEQASFVEILKNAFVNLPERELYSFGCTEVTQYIQDGKDNLAEIEDEIKNNQPLIFYEFSKASNSEQQDMLILLKNTQEFTTLETQDSWYIWREKLINPLKASFEENLNHLKRDEKYLNQIIGQINTVGQKGEYEIEELRQVTNAKHERMTLLAQEERQKILDVNDAIEMKKARLQELKDKIAELNIHHDATSIENERRRVLRQSKLEQIAADQAKCSEFVVSDPKELLSLKEDFELLCHSHQWKLIKANPETIHLSYDNRVDVSFKYIDGTWLLSVNLLDQKDELTMEWFEFQLQKYSKECKPSEWSNILHGIALLCGQLDVFRQDLETLGAYCPYEVSLKNDQEQNYLVVHMKYAHLARRLCFDVELRLIDLAKYVSSSFDIEFKSTLPFTQFNENHARTYLEDLPTGFNGLSTIGSRLNEFTSL